MAWLKVDQTIRDHHKILDAADLLQTTDAHVTGCLVLLWLWAIDNAPDGSLAGISDATIARAAKWPGEKSTFIEALKEVGLLDETAEGLAIHDWQDRAGELIDRRRADAERKRRERAEKKNRESSEQSDPRPEGRPADVHTQSRVDKSRERVEHSREGSGDSVSSAPGGPAPADVQEQRFERFWNAYPKKVGKAEARKAWKKAKITSEIFEKVLTAIEAGKAAEQWQREGGRFIPNPATWINQGRWDDELEQAQTAGAAIASRAPKSSGKSVNTIEVLAGIISAEEELDRQDPGVYVEGA